MSSGVGMGACCLSGTIQEGTTSGREETIGGLSTYVAEPAGDSKAKTVVILTDSKLSWLTGGSLLIDHAVFGWKFKNVRLCADNYAKEGFYVYIPDVHSGSSCM